MDSEVFDLLICVLCFPDPNIRVKPTPPWTSNKIPVHNKKISRVPSTPEPSQRDDSYLKIDLHINTNGSASLPWVAVVYINMVVTLLLIYEHVRAS